MNPLKILGLALGLTVLAIVFSGFTGHSWYGIAGRCVSQECMNINVRYAFGQIELFEGKRSAVQPAHQGVRHLLDPPRVRIEASSALEGQVRVWRTMWVSVATELLHCDK